MTAKVEDYGHSRAAGLRRDVQAEKGFKDTLHSVLTDPRYLDESRRYRILVFLQENVGGGPGLRKEAQHASYVWGHEQPKLISEWALQELRQLEATAGKENKDVRLGKQYRPVESARDVWNGSYDPEAPFRENELERARILDEAADRDGEWVKLLHEHPIHEEYKKAHPDFTFGVHEMIELERLVNRDGGVEGTERYLREGRFDDIHFISFMTVTKDLQIALEATIEHGRGDDVDDLLTEYSELVTNDATTLNDLVELNEKLRRRHNAQLAADVEERVKVLEDVQSGRASQPPQPTDLQEAA